MSKPSPLPILVSHCNLKLGVLRRILPPVYYPNSDSLHRLVKAKVLKPRIHRLLCDLTLTEWGHAQDPGIKRLLWDCYFPGHRPHLLHIMFYVFEIPMSTLIEKSGLTEGMLRKYLSKPKVPERVVKALGRFAIEYRDALASRKAKNGRDPRYMMLHRAMVSRSRMTKWGDIHEE